MLLLIFVSFLISTITTLFIIRYSHLYTLDPIGDDPQKFHGKPVPRVGGIGIASGLILDGINDNFDLQNAHVIPALIRKFYEAKEKGDKSVALWGTCSSLREFLHADDAADAIVFLMKNYNEKGLVNVGTGEDISIKGLAMLIKEIVSYNGEIIWDTSKPDGTPRRPLDVTKIHSLGWRHSIGFRKGLSKTYEWFKKHYKIDARL